MASLEEAVEAVLFIESSPVELKKLSRLLEAQGDQLIQAIENINSRYRESGSVLEIERIETSYRMGLKMGFTHPVLTEYSGKKKRISKALLEVLAIIAYKQPITKAEVDDIRGVNSAVYVKILLDDDLIKIAGKKDSPGKPLLYKTTHKFLSHFGLSSLKELPTVDEIKTYDFLEDQEEDIEENEGEDQEATEGSKSSSQGNEPNSTQRED